MKITRPDTANERFNKIAFYALFIISLGRNRNSPSSSKIALLFFFVAVRVSKIGFSSQPLRVRRVCLCLSPHPYDGILFFLSFLLYTKVSADPRDTTRFILEQQKLIRGFLFFFIAIRRNNFEGCKKKGKESYV